MQTETQSTEGELKRLFQLAWPLAWSYLGSQLLTLVGISIVGRLGEVPFAGVGLGNSLFYGAIILGIGIMLGVDPLVSQAIGAKEPGTARRVLWQGIWLAGLLTIPLSVLVLIGRVILGHTGMDPQMVHEMSKYVLARLPGIFPLLCLVGSRAYLQSHGSTRPYLISVIVANVVNLPLATTLVLGDKGLVGLGLPAIGFAGLGVVGAGLATTLCTTLQTAIVVGSALGYERDTTVSRRADPLLLRAAVRLGIPIGVTMFAEISVFSLTAMLAGWLGPRSLAAHQIAITLASTTFQIAMAIGAAASVRVGQAVGRGDHAAARRAGLIALGFSTFVMSITAAGFLLAPWSLGSFVSNDHHVLTAAIPLIFIAAAFQLFDGAQAVMAGNLRGAGDTRFAMYANIAGHLAVGFPTSLYLAFVLKWGAAGLWWGLCAGLVAVSVALSIRFVRISAKPILRVTLA